MRMEEKMLSDCEFEPESTISQNGLYWKTIMEDIFNQF